MFNRPTEIDNSLLKSNKILKISVPSSLLIADILLFIFSEFDLPLSFVQDRFFLFTAWIVVGLLAWGTLGTATLSGIAISDLFKRKKQELSWSVVALSCSYFFLLILGILFWTATTH